VCIVDHGYPLAFPVNFQVTHRESAVRIVVRASSSSAIGTYEGPASFEIDQIDLENVSAWSVIARGALRKPAIDDELPDTYPLVTEGRYQWKVLDVTAISGRRFSGAVPVQSGCFSVDWQPSEN